MKPRQGRTDVPAAHICAVCQRPLQQVVTYMDGVNEGKGVIIEFEHALLLPGTPEHEMVPMLLEDYADQVSICDLCGAPAPTWEFPVADFEEPILPGEVYHSVENWYACEACKTDVVAGLFEGPVQRHCVNHPDHNDRSSRQFLRQMHQGFRDNVQGPPWKIGS